MKLDQLNSKERTKTVENGCAGLISSLKQETREAIASRQTLIDNLQAEQRLQEKTLADLDDPDVLISYSVELDDTDSYQTGDPYPSVKAAGEDLAEALIAAIHKWQRNSGWKSEDIIAGALEKRNDPWPRWRVQAIVDGRTVKVPDKAYKMLLRTLDLG